MSNFDILASHIKYLLENDERTYLLIGDGLEYYFIKDLKNTCSESVKNRIINIGISEQNAISLAAGLAMGGMIPYILMFSPFMIMRAAEQIKLNVCYANTNVKLIGTNAGMSYTFWGGYSHCLIEDIALLNALPNIKIFSPSANEDEFRKILKETHEDNGPVYIRLNAAFVPNVLNNVSSRDKSTITKVIKGKKAIIIGTGFGARLAYDIAKEIKSKLKYLPSVYSAWCLKPFDTKAIQNLIKKRIPIICIEDHAKGGLSSMIAVEIAKSGIESKFLPINIDTDQFNCVKMSIEAQLNAFLDYDNILLKYFKLVEDKRLLFLSKIVTLTPNRERCTKFKIFGITIFSIIRRLKRKKWKLRNKYYLLNFRII